MTEHVAPVIEFALYVDRRRRLLDLPDGVTEVMGFYCEYDEWYRLERQVRVPGGVRLVTLACADRHDLSPPCTAACDQAMASSCDCPVNTPHTVGVHGQLRCWI
ncbi:MAG: hypothetical protein NT062_11230 [Proteobacteria bacterium]|nr:hypothetical protein [Pseudomonadota bacterium]